MGEKTFIVKCGSCGAGVGNISLSVEVQQGKILFMKGKKKVFVRFTCGCGNSIRVPTTVARKGLV